MADYFVIQRLNENQTAVYKFSSKRDLQIALQEGKFVPKFVGDIDEVDEVEYWEYDSIMIIKGNIIVPEAKEQVTVWEV